VIERATLTVPEAAVRLGIGQSTAYDLIARGEFPVLVRQIGQRYRVPARALERWLDGEQGPGVTEPHP
jgi:excisionase family DNA binding protein